MMYGVLNLVNGEPTREDTEAMRTYLESGRVSQEYLESVLGDQSETVSVFPRDTGIEDCV